MTTTELYRACMQLSEEARSLQMENEGMKRLGLNAQVLAAQTGQQGSALEVIVAEIGRLSGGIREVLTRLGDAAKVLSSTAIEILHMSHLRGSYVLGRDAGIEPASVRRFDETLDGIQRSRTHHLDELSLGLAQVETLIQDLSRIAQQIPPVTTMIRIVVTEITSHSDALLGTVDDLKGFYRNLDEKVERMKTIRGSGAHRIQELRKEDR
jgi:hypothetical protein